MAQEVKDVVAARMVQVMQDMVQRGPAVYDPIAVLLQLHPQFV